MKTIIKEEDILRAFSKAGFEIPVQDEQDSLVLLSGSKTRLERNVQQWVNEQAESYDDGAKGVLTDLMRGGCSSGIVGHLIYYTDTLKFFQTHRREISALLSEIIQDSGMQPAELFPANRNSMGWDILDPLAQENQNRNLLAWFGFEETAQRLASRNDIEI